MYRDTDEMGSSSWFFLGLAVGGAAALLLAPQSGRETRDRLQEGIRTGGEKARDAASKIAQKGQQVVEQGKDWVNRTAGEASRMAQGTAPADAFREKMTDI